MAAEWWIKEASGETGPMAPADLLQLARSARVTPETEVRKGADGKWIPARRIRGLFDTDFILPEYEFAIDQQEPIEKLAYYMRRVGLFLTLIGLLQLATGGGLIADAFGLLRTTEPIVDARHLFVPINLALVGLLLLCTGLWTRGAARSYQRIVESQGSDMTHLMNALNSQRKIYGLQHGLIMLCLLLMLLVLAITAGAIVMRGNV